MQFQQSGMTAPHVMSAMEVPSPEFGRHALSAGLQPVRRPLRAGNGVSDMQHFANY
jgi:hypothetical protein